MHAKYTLITPFKPNRIIAREAGVEVPELPDSLGFWTLTGSYRGLLKIAAHMRWLFIVQNGYNPITVTRVKGKTLYTVRAHFGMNAYMLAHIKRNS